MTDERSAPTTSAARLRRAGLRATRARLAVLDELRRDGGPVTAQHVIGRVEGEGIDRVTVYRTLNTLVERGLAHRVEPGDRVWRFAAAASDGGAHAHFVCDECGDVRCLDGATVRVDAPDGAPLDLDIKQADVYLHGTCERCDGSDRDDAG